MHRTSENKDFSETQHHRGIRGEGRRFAASALSFREDASLRIRWPPWAAGRCLRRLEGLRCSVGAARPPRSKLLDLGIFLPDHPVERLDGGLIPKTTEQLLADADEWGPSGVLGLGALVLLFR